MKGNKQLLKENFELKDKGVLIFSEGVKRDKIITRAQKLRNVQVLEVPEE